VRVYFLLLFSLLFTIPWALGITDLVNQHKGQAKQLLNAYKAATKLSEDQKAIEYKNREFPYFYSNLPCTDCPTLSRTTNQINQVLKAMAEKEKGPERLELLGEVGKLEGVVAIMRDREGDCRRLPFGVDLEYGEQYLNQDRVLVFSKEVEIDSVVHAYLREGETQHWFYRGREEDRNKLVRITQEQGRPAKIYYYILRNIPVKKQRQKLPSAAGGPTTAEKNHNVYSVIGNTDNKTKGKRQYLNIGLGFEHDKGLPKKVILLQGKSDSKPIDGTPLKVKTDVEVTSDDQKAGVALVGPTREYVRVGVNSKTEVTVEIPYKFTITDLVISTKVMGMVDAKGTTEYGINNDIAISKDSSLRIQLQNRPYRGSFATPDEREQKVWVGYQLSF
jgi:hypothetical protein